MKVAGSVALVTGAGRGIGAALVRQLAATGARRIYATGRDPRHFREIEGDKVRLAPLDVCDPSGPEAVARFAHDATLVFNNAGSMTSGPLLDTPIADIARDFETNAFGVLRVLRAFAGVVERNGGGAIVNILSIAALASTPDAAGYAASKAAAHSMTQAARAELRSRGVAVIGVYPGPVATAMTEGLSIARADPDETARAIIEGVESGEDEIFPDRMALQSREIWLRNPHLLEESFQAISLR